MFFKNGKVAGGVLSRRFDAKGGHAQFVGHPENIKFYMQLAKNCNCFMNVGRGVLTSLFALSNGKP
jgi:hypothetical protein